MKKQPMQEHAGFQFGTNPMQMSEYEKQMIMLERQEREDATRKYIQGIQGRDGGAFPKELQNLE